MTREERDRELDAMRADLVSHLSWLWHYQRKVSCKHSPHERPACVARIRHHVAMARALDAVRELAWQYEELCK